MKKIYASLVLLGTASALHAQVTMTSAMHGYVIGDQYTSHACDTTGINPGPSGTGQTWNFSGVVINPATTTQTYVTPGSTPYAASFPSATAAADGGGGNYGYFTTSSSQIAIAGTANSATTIPYSDPEIVQVFPFAYGNTNTDNFSANYTVSSMPATRNGTCTVTADGSGTLVLPSGSYPVLRVHLRQQFQDVYSSITTDYDYQSWYYYSATQKFPLFAVNILSTTFFSNTTVVKAIQVNDAVVGMNEQHALQQTFTLFPNPASGNSTIAGHLDAAADVTITLSDLTGRTVQTIRKGELPAGPFVEMLDLNGLPAGLYTISVQAGEKVGVRKLSVQ